MSLWSLRTSGELPAPLQNSKKVMFPDLNYRHAPNMSKIPQVEHTVTAESSLKVPFPAEPALHPPSLTLCNQALADSIIMRIARSAAQFCCGVDGTETAFAPYSQSMEMGLDDLYRADNQGKSSPLALYHLYVLIFDAIGSNLLFPRLQDSFLGLLEQRGFSTSWFPFGTWQLILRFLLNLLSLKPTPSIFLAITDYNPPLGTSRLLMLDIGPFCPFPWNRYAEDSIELSSTLTEVPVRIAAAVNAIVTLFQSIGAPTCFLSWVVRE
ncbi:hypothetical protein P389DRAFT_191759 [Cystobasidium minutum MCA 4210]|uniref:uncharacterized protein n=1 Tax=Cystobasidium minutum MCA 4210 TaxID=1397322 RepID=UPI0034CECA6F|eukprot:jgi/Rhomi1/191759/estExt_fgenesh1_pg.C_120027